MPPPLRSGSSPNHFDEANFTPTNFVHIVTTINIQGPNDNDGAFLTGFQQRFSEVEVPEPSSVVLGMFALFGALLVRNKRYLDGDRWHRALLR
jgi:PEP-CTERM motif